MYLETRKMHLIEDVIKLTSETSISKLENIMKVIKKEKSNPKKSIKDFVGVISEKDGNAMLKAINETCENIDYDEWK